MFGTHEPIRAHFDDPKRPGDRTLVARDGLALHVRVRPEPGLAPALEGWFEAVTADLDLARFDRAWVGARATQITGLDERRLGSCRSALAKVGDTTGYFWIGGDDDPDNPGFVIAASLPPTKPQTKRPIELSVRLASDWACARGWAELREDIARWLGELPLESGWVGPSIHRGLMDPLSHHLRPYWAAVAPQLWARPGWVPHDDRSLGPAPGRLEHLGWITLIGEPLIDGLGEALEVTIAGLERHRAGRHLQLVAGPAPALADDEALAPVQALARALEPHLDLRRRQPIDEWLQGSDNQIAARCKAWLRRHLDPRAYLERAKRELGRR